jgi:hypothetical protein
MQCKCRACMVLLFLILTISVSSVQAQQIYTYHYSGPNYTGAGSPAPDFPSWASMHTTIDFTTTLSPDEIVAAGPVVPLTFSMSDSVRTITMNDPGVQYYVRITYVTSGLPGTYIIRIWSPSPPSVFYPYYSPGMESLYAGDYLNGQHRFIDYSFFGSLENGSPIWGSDIVDSDYSLTNYPNTYWTVTSPPTPAPVPAISTAGLIVLVCALVLIVLKRKSLTDAKSTQFFF